MRHKIPKYSNFITNLSKQEIYDIFAEEVDNIPNIFQSLMRFSLSYYFGNSRVCGSMHFTSFELRNRRSPHFSLRAIGEFSFYANKTDIRIEWTKPKYPDLMSVYLINRYKYDHIVITTFMNEWLIKA
jgi:NRPS condensation-like uncharacterized protein